MKKYLAITAALALALTACGQAAADRPQRTARRHRLRPRKPQRPPPSSRKVSAAAPCGC